jgi:hypothetical protein
MIPANNTPTTDGSLRRRDSDGIIKIAAIATVNLTSTGKCDKAARKESKVSLLTVIRVSANHIEVSFASSS